MQGGDMRWVSDWAPFGRNVRKDRVDPDSKGFAGARTVFCAETRRDADRLLQNPPCTAGALARNACNRSSGASANARALEQHRVAVAEEPVALPDRVADVRSGGHRRAN